MEQVDVENEKFLKVLGSPFKSFCMVFSLKIGVVYIAIFDVLIGIINLLAGSHYLWKIFIWEEESVALSLKVLQCLTTLTAIPFALVGCRGIIQSYPPDLKKYSNFKKIEFFIMTFLSLVRIIIHEIHNMILTFKNFMTFINELLGPFVLLLMVKTVWSAYIRLKCGQDLLVNQGEELTPISIPPESPGHRLSPSVNDLPASNCNSEFS
jgi:hypothetical protein